MVVKVLMVVEPFLVKIQAKWIEVQPTRPDILQKTWLQQVWRMRFLYRYLTLLVL